MRLALAMIVKGSDEEALLLDRCLNSVAEHVDGIFITVTQPNKAVKKVVEAYGGQAFDYKWNNDFAEARNFSFAQVPSDYTHILWLDADDIIENPEKLKPTIETNENVDTFSFWYLYWFDEWNNPTIVHHKTRIVKNDGCVKWVGKLHEDFAPQREITPMHVEGIRVIHLSDDERVEVNKERNLVVALEQVKNLPKDPRSYWNLGNSYKALQRNEEALSAFDKFLETSDSEEEAYIVRLRRAEIFWSAGNYRKAIDEARYAIGTRPEYPDGYFLMGSLYLNTEQSKEAATMYKIGLSKKPPYHKIMMYNPRDYDYEPLKNLAKAYIQLNQPLLALNCLKACQKINPHSKELNGIVETLTKEAKKFEKATKIVKFARHLPNFLLRRILDRIPAELQAMPIICNLRNTRFIKTESSGKDLVYFCGYTEKEWNPETPVGGSEEAVINLTKRWAKKGWNVTVYNTCGAEVKTYDGVTYKPFWMYNVRDKVDVTIMWRTPRLSAHKINTGKLIVDLHDVIQDGEFTKERLERIDYVFVKSEFHKSLFPSVPEKKFIVLPNGIDPDELQTDVKRDKNLIINTSSPDRSLSAFIKVAREVKKQRPNTKFQWAYGWDIFDVVNKTDAEPMEWKAKIVKEMNEVGIEQLGKVSRAKVADMYQQAKVFLYTTEFAEIDCISVTKALWAGANVVSTDFAAIGEKTHYGGWFTHSEKNKDNWCQPYQFDFSVTEEKQLQEIVKNTIEALDTPNKRKEKVASDYNWDKIASEWEQKMV